MPSYAAGHDPNMIALKSICLLVSLLLAPMAFAQNQPTDQKVKETTLIADSLAKMIKRADQLSQNDPDQAEAIGIEALQLASQLQDARSTIQIYLILGNIEKITGDFKSANDAYEVALNEARSLNQHELEASVLASIAEMYFIMEDYTQAIDYAKNGLEIGKEVLHYPSMASNYSIIASIKQYIGEPDEALYYFRNALRIFQNLEMHEEQAATLKSIGDIHLSRSYYDRAIGYYDQALDIVQGTNKLEQARILIRLADAKIKKKDYQQARIIYGQALSLSLSIRSRPDLAECLLGLSRYFEELKEYDSAFFYYKDYVDIKERYLDNSKQIARLESIKFRQKAESLREEYVELESVKERDDERSEEAFFFFMVALMVMLFTIIFFYRGNEKHKRDKMLLLQKNEEIQAQKDEILKQQKVISDNADELGRQNDKINQSMRSANMIQSAILPGPEKFKMYFSDYFILYRPRDIVSGDFYWLEKINNTTFIAAADCTGHGVPGAFMSMIGHALLDKIIMLQQIYDPADILNSLRNEVKSALNQEENNSVNGMDIIMLAIDKDEASDRLRVRFSGAKRPLLYFEKDATEIGRIKGDNIAIGGLRKADKNFTTKELIIEKGGTLYLTSDGYTDQNGPSQKKIGISTLEQLLEKKAGKPLQEQGELLEKYLDDHQGNYLQRDDIMLIGVRL